MPPPPTMSLRHALRSRFRGDKEKENNKEASVADSRDSSPWRGDHDDDSQSSSTKTSSTSPDEESLSSASSVVESKRPSAEVKQSLRDQDEKSIYEMQLNHLQEQLVAAMIENQNLSDDIPSSDTGRELSSYKEKHQVERIMKDLDFEKQRNQQLSQQLDEAKHHRSWSLRKRKLQRTSTEPIDGDSRGMSGIDPLNDSLSSDWVDVAQEATEGILEPQDSEPRTLSRPSGPKALRDRLHEWLVHTFYELMADFTEEPEVETQDDREGDPLTVKKLKENIKRFRNDAKPIVSTFKGVQRLLMWRTPSVTLIAFMVYMYSVWIGWLVPVLLFLVIFRLSLNYLTYKGWNVNIVMLAEPEEEDKNKETDTFKDLGMSDKFNLVVQVARQVQNILGKLADSLEKLKNLLMWRQPESTMQLYLVLCVSFVLSCVLPGKTLFTLIALYMGIKMFIIEYIFTRFPRIKRRHDTTYRIWQGLPTDSLLEKQYQKAAIDRSVLPVRSEPSTTDSERLHDDDKGFCDLFSLPVAEHPLPGWRGGRRCTLINRDKSLTAAFKHGKLYLTRSFLCFERSKTTAMKNIVIPLTEITRIEKAKPYSWMPGGGMSIEVTVQDQEKPYMFGAILNRDECFDSIVANGIKANLPWAQELSLAAPSPGATPASPTVPSLHEGSAAAVDIPLAPIVSAASTAAGSTGGPPPSSTSSTATTSSTVVTSSAKETTDNGENNSTL